MKIRVFNKEGQQVDEKNFAHFPVVLGRAAKADVVIQDEKVSGEHVRITKEASGFFLHDLGTTNGTRLEGKSDRIQTCALTLPLVIMVGQNIKIKIESTSPEELSFAWKKIKEEQRQAAAPSPGKLMHSFGVFFKTGFEGLVMLDQQRLFYLTLAATFLPTSLDAIFLKSPFLISLATGTGMALGLWCLSLFWMGRTWLTGQPLKSLHRTMIPLALALNLLGTALYLTAPLSLSTHPALRVWGFVLSFILTGGSIYLAGLTAFISIRALKNISRALAGGLATCGAITCVYFLQSQAPQSVFAHLFSERRVAVVAALAPLADNTSLAGQSLSAFAEKFEADPDVLKAWEQMGASVPNYLPRTVASEISQVFTAMTIEACPGQLPTKPSRLVTGAPMSARFVNQSKNIVFVSWIDAKGQTTAAQELGPAQTFLQHAFIGYRWQLADSLHRCLGEYSGTESQQEVVILDTTSR